MAKLKTQHDKTGGPIGIIILVILVFIYIVSYGPFMALMQNDRVNSDFASVMDAYVFKPHLLIIESLPAYYDYIQWWTELGGKF
ncbi:hypothetical protein KAJ27_12610 [bacterium]|nr:hypothetical protein [bacterium]